jgi:hypothetical protein
LNVLRNLGDYFLNLQRMWRHREYAEAFYLAHHVAFPSRFRINPHQQVHLHSGTLGILSIKPSKFETDIIRFGYAVNGSINTAGPAGTIRGPAFS